MIVKIVREISWVLFLSSVTRNCFWRFFSPILSWTPPNNVLTMFLTLVSSSEIPQGLFQRDAPICDVSPTHQQSGADSFETHHLWVLTVLQERSLWLQQPRDGLSWGWWRNHQCSAFSSKQASQCRAAPRQGPGLPPAAAGRRAAACPTPRQFIPSAWVWGWDALLADGDPDGQILLSHCDWMWPFPHSASFSLHIRIHPLWQDGCDLTIGFSEPSQHGTVGGSPDLP